MTSFSSILPGARVRGPDGFIGTVERLVRRAGPGQGGDDQPDTMIVRSDDGRWRYALPLLLVTDVSQEMLHTIVNVRLAGDELPHYITEELDTGAEREAAGTATGANAPEGGDVVVPLAMEELRARKEPAQVGSVRVHKGVETIRQHLTVPVYHEEAVVERIRPDQYDGKAPSNPSEVIVPVMEERLVVRKETVVTEYLRIRKRLVTDQREIDDTVRRETVSVYQTRTDDPSASGEVPVTDLGSQPDGNQSAEAQQQPQRAAQGAGTGA